MSLTSTAIDLISQLNNEQKTVILKWLQDDLAKASHPNVRPVESDNGIVIHFCESTAGSFAGALRTSLLSTSNGSYIENKKTWYFARYEAGDFESAAIMANALSAIRNKRVMIDGIEQDWSNVFSFVWCSTQRTKDYRPDQYCFGISDQNLNPWGCRQANMPWTEWSAWFNYGHFEQQRFLGREKTYWVFDKQRIKHDIANNIFKFKLCPHLKTTLIDNVIKALPDKIDMAETKDWKYHEAFSETPQTIRIAQRSSLGFGAEHFLADGVRPSGPATLIELLKSASHADTSAQQILQYLPRR